MLLHLRWHKQQKLAIFWPNPWQTIKIAFNWLVLKQPAIKHQFPEDIDCYWISGGVWGSYYLPNKIYICPRKATPQFLEQVIEHEITHLKYENEVKNMTHQEKEAHITAKQIDSRK
ncbi:MAG: hypothetical protein Q8P73_04675 [bacterium]|nr:hypothetical protein [bacterium]